MDQWLQQMQLAPCHRRLQRPRRHPRQPLPSAASKRVSSGGEPRRRSSYVVYNGQEEQLTCVRDLKLGHVR